MDRDEFALYDIIKTLAFAGILFSVALMCAGKKALMSVNMGTQKPGFVAKLFKRTLFRLAFMALCIIFIHLHIKEAKMVAGEKHNNNYSGNK